MKKLSILTILVLSSMVTFAQVGLNTYYGSTKKIGFDMFYGKKNSIVYGIGLSVASEAYGVGRDYTSTMGPNSFPKDIYSVKVGDNSSLYGIVGYNLNNMITIGGKIGIGGQTKFFNSYDRHQILSSNGYYYTSQDMGSKMLVGGFASVRVGKVLTINTGYDTYNGVQLGVGMFIKIGQRY
jgi:hypothetical protein